MTLPFTPEIGSVFGDWTVLSAAPQSANQKSRCRCQCKCGREHDVLVASLLNGKSSKCYRCARRVTDRVGQRVGRLLILAQGPNDQNGRTQWLARCDCGTEKLYANGNLRDSTSTSCGCYRRERMARLGKIQVGENNAKWKGGKDSDHCFCARALGQSRKAGKARGYAACSLSVEELITSVTDKCELCGIPERELSKRLCLDHDHKTGKFRGWLCERCNRVVGFIDANQAAVNKYLHLRKS